MKKVFLTLTIALLCGFSSFAQRFAYMDSQYILNHVPDYISAQKELKSLSDQWQKEVDARFQELDRMYKAYQADQVLMTPDMKKHREADIVEKEKAAKDFQRSKFGPEGELAQAKQHLDKTHTRAYSQGCSGFCRKRRRRYDI